MKDVINQLLKRISEKNKQILFIGDVILDRWVHGVTSHCQDNCIKFTQEAVVETPGGAANAERCLTYWKINTLLYGYNIIDCPIKSRYIENNSIMFRTDNDGSKFRHLGYKWAHQLAIEMVPYAGAVLLSDYEKGFLTPELIDTVSALCEKHKVPCIADCKREPGLYKRCILKCNINYQHKYNQALSMMVLDADESKGRHLVVTAGKLNPICWGGDGPMGLGYDLPPVQCINHVGAGDCFAAHLTLALAYGFSLRESMALAHSAGRVYVQHPHNQPPTPEAIAADMSNAVVPV